MHVCVHNQAVCVCDTHGDGGMGPPPPWVVPFPPKKLLYNPKLTEYN